MFPSLITQDCTESIDCILLSLLALNVILLTSSLSTLGFSLLNRCCDFIINLLLFRNSLWLYVKISVSSFFRCFISLFCWFTSRKFSKSSNLIFCFTTHFKCLLLFYIHHYHVLNNYRFLISMQQALSLFWHQIQLLLIHKLLYFSSS